MAVARQAAVACVVAALLSGAARAGCPGDAGEPLPPSDKLPALEQELARLAPECGARAGYLAYRGAVLNALGRPAEAAPLLELALLLEPLRAGAQIDYAAALAALGDTAGAAALLREVLVRPDVPAHLRPRLEQRLTALDASATRADAPVALPGLRERAGAGWRGGGSLTLRLGRDSNLNSAPSRDTLTLTQPSGDIVLLLADRFRARPGTAALVEANGQLTQPLEGGAALQFYGEARLRASSAVPDTNYQQYQAVAAWGRPLATGDVLISAGAVQLNYDGTDLYHALRLAASRDWQADRCRPRLGVEGEARRYPAVPNLAGRFFGVGAALSCERGRDSLTFAARVGADAAQADRPGGNQRQLDLRVAWARLLGRGRLETNLLLSHQRDSSGYSPLLENGATRHINRASVRLEYAYPIAPGWALLASADSLTQRSNLQLFDLSGRAFYLGLRWTR